jgi:hypothetical protein
MVDVDLIVVVEKNQKDWCLALAILGTRKGFEPVAPSATTAGATGLLIFF